jgi:hypothetical protein
MSGLTTADLARLADIPSILWSEAENVALLDLARLQVALDELPGSVTFERFWDGSRIGLPTMTEASLIHAYRRCECAEDTERMPWESWSEGQWAWYRRRQRVVARRIHQREARAEA